MPESLIPIERIANVIYLIRGQKVMLDSDLAELYNVTTGRLNEQVKRNLKRFPEEFAFQLSDEEFKSLLSQNAIANEGRGGRRSAPWAFTEHGVIMLSSVLKSDRAAEVNIAVVRTFVRLRSLLSSNEELAKKVQEHDKQISALYQHLQKLLHPPENKNKNPIGFRVDKKK